MVFARNLIQKSRFCLRGVDFFRNCTRHNNAFWKPALKTRRFLNILFAKCLKTAVSIQYLDPSGEHSHQFSNILFPKCSKTATSTQYLDPSDEHSHQFLNILIPKCLKTVVSTQYLDPNDEHSHQILNILNAECLKTRVFFMQVFANHCFLRTRILKKTTPLMQKHYFWRPLF